MSDKKQFTPRDLAVKILENVYEQIKKSEVLAKSKNTAHEIDNGEEPKNDEAECPESLEAADFSGESSKEENKNPKKKKKPESESGEMEESESEESQSEEGSEEPEYEFKKSESGMRTIEYKALKKARVDEGKSKQEKIETREDRGMTQKRGERNPFDRGTTGSHVHHDTEWSDRDKPGKNVNYGIHNKKKAVSDIKEKAKQNIEAHKQNRPNLPKSEGYSEMEKADEPKRPVFGIDHSKEKQVEHTKRQKAWTDYDRSGMPGAKRGSRKDQLKFDEEAKQRRSQYKDQGLLKSKDEKKSEDKKKEDQPLQDCGAPMDKSSHNKVEETKGIDLDKKKKADKDMENFKRPLEKCGDVEKVGKSDTCGIKKSEKGVEKLKKFLGK